MKKQIFNLLLLFICFSVHGETFDVEFLKIADNAWIHRSYELLDGYKTPSNGLILEAEKTTIIIDTAWNDEETEQIVKFAKTKLHKSASACFITHFHQDRAGGINVISKNQIPIFMSSMTDRLLKDGNYHYKYKPIINEKIKIDTLTLAIDYFGPAHSPDNIIIWDSRDKLLFGGCLMKPLNSKNLGNIADADVKNWPIVLMKLKEKYTNIKIIIPGHGEPGDIKLLDHTLQLLTKK